MLSKYKLCSAVPGKVDLQAANEKCYQMKEVLYNQKSPVSTYILCYQVQASERYIGAAIDIFFVHSLFELLESNLYKE